MQELGQWLKKTRVETGMTLAEMEEKTKIRQRYLEAIEAGDMKSLPEPVYTLGFLRSYARQINVDENQVAQYYKDWQTSQKTSADSEAEIKLQNPSGKEKKQVKPQEKEKKERQVKPAHPIYSYTETRDRRFRKGFGWVIIVIVVIAAVAALYMLGKNSGKGGDTPSDNPAQQQQPANQAPQIPEEPTDGQPIDDTPTIDEPTTENPMTYTGVNLIITAETGDCWLGITVDGKYSQETLAKGMVKEVTGDQLVKIRYGNPGAVKVVFNGETMESFGDDRSAKTVEYSAP